MTFREFDNQAEQSLYSSILSVCMLHKGQITLRLKVLNIAEVIKLYSKQYEKLTSEKPDIFEVLEAIQNYEQ